jgi:hypothetical protein
MRRFCIPVSKLALLVNGNRYEVDFKFQYLKKKL